MGVISREKWSNGEREKYDKKTRDRPKREDISTDFCNHLRVVCILGEFSYRDRVESEIGDHREYREVIVDLGIESISSDIEIAREELDEEYGYQSGDDLPSDLCESIGVYFTIWHEGEYMGNDDKVKIK